ncbi:MAG: glucosamine-6-phosphate deaminase [Clostridia bacterium]|nr:glucosamine-6-phosphate deaminase [Clostridia bacterium]
MSEIRSFKKDELTVRVFDTRENMGVVAAAEAKEWIKEALSKKDEINIIFAAAPSQNDFLRSLIKEDIEWNRINAYHMDEYIGLSEDAPQGFANFLRRAIFDLVPFKSVNCFNGQNPDPKAECERYTKLLLDNPCDIIFMGIGENGHIAFNDPGFAFFNDPETVKIVKLDEVCRNQQVNDGCFASIDLVPTHAYTLTVPIMMSAPKMMLVVPTALKAKAIHDTVLGPVTEMVPASVVRTHKGGAVLYTDEAGAKLI